MMQISTIIFVSFEKCCCHHRRTSSGQDIDCKYTLYDKHKFKKLKFMISISVKIQYPIIFRAYLRNLILSFCLEHLTSSIASDRDVQSIPLIAITSSPMAIDWDISAFPPGVTWNSKTRSLMLWIWNTSSETFKLQD